MASLKYTLLIAATFFSGLTSACNIDFTIHLETFGEGVLVELRTGKPGASKVVRSTRSTGGTVNFSALCPGPHFVAIGNDDSVSVTPSRVFENDVSYTSRITMQKGSGNVDRKSRKSL